MKKLTATFLLLLLLCGLMLPGCEDVENKTLPQGEAPPFADISWVRKGEHDSEALRFWSDGRFSYTCGCGNPVNDADLCQGYRYDPESQTLTLDYLEMAEEAVPVITVVSYDGQTLQLNFNGEIRTFHKE